MEEGLEIKFVKIKYRNKWGYFWDFICFCIFLNFSLTRLIKMAILWVLYLKVFKNIFMTERDICAISNFPRTQLEESSLENLLKLNIVTSRATFEILYGFCIFLNFSLTRLIKMAPNKDLVIFVFREFSRIFLWLNEDSDLFFSEEKHVGSLTLAEKIIL